MRARKYGYRKTKHLPEFGIETGFVLREPYGDLVMPQGIEAEMDMLFFDLANKGESVAALLETVERLAWR